MIQFLSVAATGRFVRLLVVIVLLGLFTGPATAFAESPFDAVVRSVFRISGKDSSGDPVIGTAFLVQGRGSSADSAWLVTAGHVLSRITGSHAQVDMRRQARGVFFPCPVLVKIREGDSRLYYIHAEYDLAAVQVALPAEADCCVLAREFVADDTRLARSGFGAGTRVLIPGYPYGEACNEAGFAFVRDGVVSSFPALPSSAQPVFSIDFEVFEGYSGAPAISADSSGAGFLVGMVLEEVYLEELRTQKNKKTTRTRRGLGLAKVISAPLIKSFIASLP